MKDCDVNRQSLFVLIVDTWGVMCNASFAINMWVDLLTQKPLRDVNSCWNVPSCIKHQEIVNHVIGAIKWN